MRGLVFGENQLLAPRVALNGKVDQRNDTVDVKILGGFQERPGADIRVGGPLLVRRANQPAGYAA